MASNRSLLVDSALLLSLILIGVTGYKLSPLLLPKADVTVSPPAGCDLQAGACDARLPDGGQLRLALSPRPLRPAVPLEVAVDIEGGGADRVAVDFAGVDMAMGYHRPVLASVGPGRFAGQVTLPVCVTGRMRWQATVLVESGRTRTAIPFRFDTGH